METISREMKRRLDGITYRALANALEQLKRTGLVTWTVLPTQPIGAENAKTPLGHSLRVPFEAECTSALYHNPAVDTAHAAYDAMRARKAA